MDRIRLIATDLDATLLDAQGQLPPGFYEAVHALAQEGILFVAASGRPLPKLEEMFAAERAEMGFIADNGGIVCCRGETLATSLMPREQLQALAKASHDAGKMGVLCALDAAYVEKPYAHLDSMMKRFYNRVEYVDSLADVDTPADKFSVYLPDGDAQRAYDELYGPAYVDSFSVAVAGPCWVDLMNRGVHKGAALATLGERLGISPASMMAFGDTYNDAEMLETARYSFLVENGSLPLRERAAFLAPPNTAYGVMQIVQKVLAQHGEVSPADFTPAH